MRLEGGTNLHVIYNNGSFVLCCAIIHEIVGNCRFTVNKNRHRFHSVGHIVDPILPLIVILFLNLT